MTTCTYRDDKGVACCLISETKLIVCTSMQRIAEFDTLLFFSLWLGTDQLCAWIPSPPVYLELMCKCHYFCWLYLVYFECCLWPRCQTNIRLLQKFQVSPLPPTHVVYLCPSQQMLAQAACVLVRLETVRDHLSQAVSERLFWSASEYDNRIHNHPNEPDQGLNCTTVLDRLNVSLWVNYFPRVFFFCRLCILASFYIWE